MKNYLLTYLQMAKAALCECGQQLTVNRMVNVCLLT